MRERKVGDKDTKGIRERRKRAKDKDMKEITADSGRI
jgi:hypothetical protein